MHPEPQSEPRGRIYQGTDFQVQDLAGHTLERLIGYVPQDRPRQPEVLLLKPRGKHWQRFFMDAGFGFWEEWSEEDAFAGYQDEPTLQQIDLGSELRLKDSEILEVGCSTEPDGCTRITVGTDKGRVFLRTLDPKDLDSAVEVGFAAPDA